ncbi:hypothetical protein EW145_g1712 [Phellinidium pouzarii]|uniref:SET domain-containing protein n=1 Tax=Phellinidium pouzarii TaxID=167371 RepID=A0A4S4LDR0_9AGAM|nr:hypothetical protein EW145_g1712 [Phellinidium pouzarii]
MSYSPSIPPEALQFIRGSTSSTAADIVSTLNSPVVIRRIGDLAHPAVGQMGLFASKKILSRTLIIDYLGEAHADERLDSDYDLSLHRAQPEEGVYISVGIDATRMGNEARFINDYRGVRTKPNAIFKERRTLSGELRMSVWSDSETIKKGDEILVSYGKSWWQTRQQKEY